MDVSGLGQWREGLAEACSPLALAYVGDAVYSLLARTHAFRNGPLPVGELNRRSAAMVKAAAQADLYRFLEPILTAEERAVMRRGRNAGNRYHAKNATVTDYRLATGTETLFGHLYLRGEYARLTELFNRFAESKAAAEP